MNSFLRNIANSDLLRKLEAQPSGQQHLDVNVIYFFIYLFFLRFYILAIKNFNYIKKNNYFINEFEKGQI